MNQIAVNELRIGNYVKTDHHPFAKVVCIRLGRNVIKSVRENADCYEYEINDGWLSNVEPVPLTENILKSAGFEKTKTWYSNPVEPLLRFAFDRLGCHVSMGDNDFGFKIALIHYVHELQNIFYCIAGEELEINFYKQND